MRVSSDDDILPTHLVCDSFHYYLTTSSLTPCMLIHVILHLAIEPANHRHTCTVHVNINNNNMSAPCHTLYVPVCMYMYVCECGVKC